MLSMKTELLTKIENILKNQKKLDKGIKDKSKILEIKTGKLEYILEEKEALFNKLQNELAENKELRKKHNKIGSSSKKKKKGIFSSLMGYFQKEDRDNIDVSNGKIKKNQEGSIQNLEKDFENSESYVASNPEFETIDFNQIRLDFVNKESKNDEIIIEKKKEINEIKSNEEIDENKKKINVTGNSTEQTKLSKDNNNESNEEQDEETKTSSNNQEEEDSDQEDDILERLKKNLNAVPD